MICSTVQLKNRLKNEINTQIELVDSLKTVNDNMSLQIDSLSVISAKKESKIDSLMKVKNKPIFKLVETIKYVDTSNDTIQALMAVNEVNNAIIGEYEELMPIKDSIINSQAKIILNDKEIQNQLELAIKDKDLIIKDYNDRLIKEKNKKIFFEITTATAVAGAVVLMII